MGALTEQRGEWLRLMKSFAIRGELTQLALELPEGMPTMAEAIADELRVLEQLADELERCIQPLVVSRLPSTTPPRAARYKRR